MSEGRVERPLKDMKPGFMMPKSTPHNLLHNRTINSPLVPGKLADESQLGQLTSLFTDTQQTKSFHAPKPPKKRYLEENYSQNKFLSTVIDNVSLNLEIPSINLPEVKKKKTDENLIFPDVNPMLPDVVPKAECKEIDARSSWRKKLLCWEKLDDTESTKQCDRLKPQTEIKTNIKISTRGRREKNSVGRKPARLTSIHCSNDSDTAGSPKPGRRGRARACKGQKYREFMWTNVIHQRRKSSRWELCQDSVDGTASTEQDLIAVNKAKTEPLQKETELISRSSTARSEVNSVDNYYKKKKATRKKLSESPSKKLDVNKIKTKIHESPKKKLLKRETEESNNPTETSSNQLFTVTGSKKRKLRRQSIRRLEPGTSFKDTRVVEDSGLDAFATITASKMKLRRSASD